VDTIGSSSQSSTPITWPLIGSLILTGIVVAFVCVPPFSGLHSWRQVFWLACLYMLVAACVHALAIWSICRLQSEGLRRWALMWPVVWGAWIAVVWLPLVALLTYEHSLWVALVLPTTALFITLFLMSRRSYEEDELAFFFKSRAARELFVQEESPRLWRLLLPSLLVAIAVESGIAMFGAGHAWGAGLLFAMAAAYVVKCFVDGVASRSADERSMRCASVGNSAAVWMLTVLALLPFLAGVSVVMRGMLGMPAVEAAKHVSNVGHRAARGYSGIILETPRIPHEIVMPVLTTHAEGFKRSEMIPFDGTYWYFKEPDTRPGPNAPVVQGNPLKKRILSTDRIPLSMEAHQRLGKEMQMDCCRTLQLNVINADAIPGSVTMEVLLRDVGARSASSVSLGNKVLVSSTVSPMPLHRAPVHETLVFQIPRAARHRSFDEITVRVKPERTQALGGAQVSIESFGFER
jgi:hypothetical protein